MACQVCHYKNLQINPTLFTSYAAVWTNHIVMKNCFQQQDKSYRSAQTRVTCFTALLFHISLSGQIRSYCKKLNCCRTNRIVMHRYVTAAPMRCCVTTCCLDKPDRIGIGIETCNVLQCTALSSSDVFGTVVLIALY